MDRFAPRTSNDVTVKSSETANLSSPSLLSLLIILEALRQEPVPMRPQKV